jgi:hypothetical protein
MNEPVDPAAARERLAMQMAQVESDLALAREARGPSSWTAASSRRC